MAVMYHVPCPAYRCPGDTADTAMSSEEFHASNPLGIKKKAQGPRFDALPEFRDDKVVAQPKPAPVPVDVATKIAELKEPRIGPYFVKYSELAAGHRYTCFCSLHCSLDALFSALPWSSAATLVCSIHSWSFTLTD